jgi:hypothetical protein
VPVERIVSCLATICERVNGDVSTSTCTRVSPAAPAARRRWWPLTIDARHPDGTRAQVLGHHPRHTGFGESHQLVERALVGGEVGQLLVAHRAQQTSSLAGHVIVVAVEPGRHSAVGRPRGAAGDLQPRVGPGGGPGCAVDAQLDQQPRRPLRLAQGRGAVGVVARQLRRRLQATAEPAASPVGRAAQAGQQAALPPSRVHRRTPDRQGAALPPAPSTTQS